MPKKWTIGPKIQKKYLFTKNTLHKYSGKHVKEIVEDNCVFNNANWIHCIEIHGICTQNSSRHFTGVPTTMLKYIVNIVFYAFKVANKTSLGINNEFIQINEIRFFDFHNFF